MSAVDDRPRVVRSQVEPRLVERRRRVHVEQRRARRRRLAVIVAIAAAVLGVIGLLLSPVLDVDRVLISGNERLDDSTVIELSGLVLGEPMVAVDLADARAALLAEPIVASARVSRRWPATLVVEIIEERPLAVFDHPGGSAVVSASGMVLGGGSERASLAVVVLEDPVQLEPGQRVQGSLRQVVAAVEQLRVELRAGVERYVLDDGMLTLRLVDDATVLVGRLDDLPAKLIAIETALEQIALECLDVLDVRDPTRATVSRIDRCDAPEPTAVLDPPASDDEAAGASPQGVGAGSAEQP